MKSKEKPPIWIIIGWILILVGAVANPVLDYIKHQRISPFSILFLGALLAGYIVTKIFKWPLYTVRPSRSAMISILILFIIVVGAILLKTCVPSG